VTKKKEIIPNNFSAHQYGEGLLNSLPLQLKRISTMKNQNPKYIFFTGGVVSSVGKGLTASSIGRLLKEHGFTVVIQKLDPYLNVDPAQ